MEIIITIPAKEVQDSVALEASAHSLVKRITNPILDKARIVISPKTFHRLNKTIQLHI